MKYDQETTKKLVDMYASQVSVPDISVTLSLICNEPVTERSIIAKLSSLGVYKKKEYLTKRGEVPIKKEEYIDRIARLLNVNAEFLESLEKVNKAVLALISTKLDTNSDPKLQ